MRRFWVVLLLAVAPVTSLHAQERAAKEAGATTDAGRANRLAHEAKLRFDAGDFKGALASFEAAAQLAQSPVFDLYVARSQRALGKYHRALGAYHRVIDLAVDAKNPPWLRAQRDALVELEALQREMPRVKVTLVPQAPITSISALLDDEICPWPIEALAVDPGPHRLRLRSGSTNIVHEFLAKPGETSDLQLEWPASTPTRTPSASPPATPPPRSVGVAERAERANLTPWMWSSFGLGAAAAAVGTTTGLIVLKRASDLRAWCKEPDHVCRDGAPDDAEQRKRQSDASRLASVSDVAFVVAGVAAAGGVVLFAFDRPAPKHEPRVKVGAGLGSFTVQGRF